MQDNNLSLLSLSLSTEPAECMTNNSMEDDRRKSRLLGHDPFSRNLQFVLSCLDLFTKAAFRLEKSVGLGRHRLIWSGSSPEN